MTNPGPSRRATRRAGAFEPISLREVTVVDDFWSPRQQTVRDITIPAQYEMLEKVGHIEALHRNWRPGQQPVPHIFWDSDVAKWIEAAAYSLTTTPDRALEQRVDAVVDLLEQAQDDDGYLNSHYQNVAPDRRFTDLRDGHELYCLGHLIEAAVAYHQATGKPKLLELVRRYADLVARTFGTGPGQKRGYPGHEEIELALVKLYRETGEQRYLDLSRYFVDERGREPFYFQVEQAERGTPGWFGREFPSEPAATRAALEYCQAHHPVREQYEAVGHSVRAMYLYCAMADLAAELGDAGLREACGRLWDNLTTRRMYVTGGIGSTARIEGFTADHHLPNETAYAETCAAIGLVMWARRMADLEDDGRYLDVLELALHNAVISGVSADGMRYFYDNPLESRGDKRRSAWFDTSCCPPNLARLTASLGSYVYSRRDDEVRVNLWIGSAAQLQADGAPLRLVQRSQLPWTGRTELGVHLDVPRHLTLSVRVPRWAQGPRVTVNGSYVDVAPERGFVRLRRQWDDGDVVAVETAMRPSRVWAHLAVAADAGRVALRRGPLVYCAEGVDNDGAVADLVLPRDAELVVTPPRGEGVRAIAAAAGRVRPADDSLYSTRPPGIRPDELVAVPYYSWANRDIGPMQVWIRDGC